MKDIGYPIRDLASRAREGLQLEPRLTSLLQVVTIGASDWSGYKQTGQFNPNIIMNCMELGGLAKWK